MENCEDIIWSPSPSFLKEAYATGLMVKMGAKSPHELWQISVSNISAFWDLVMKEMGVVWDKPYSKVLDDSAGIAFSKWFVGGKLNIAANCVDRHTTGPSSLRTAILWESDDGQSRELSYAEFGKLVNQAANALKSLGVGPSDTVGILMSMVPEVMVQMFACFKIGATAIPIFSGFGVDAVASRLRDAKAKVLFTSDISVRRGKTIEVKKLADQATKEVPSLQHRVVFKRGDGSCDWDSDIDLWWHEAVLSQSDSCQTLSVESEHRSLIIFTSGTTGKPKGSIHTHAGCIAQIGKELRYAFNVDEQSRFFWFTDIGWMMGPWEMIGVSFFGGTLMLFEGAPDYPSPDRLWQTIEKNRITHLGISPTAVRLLMRSGNEFADRHSMPSLKILGSTGEPWDPESYQWFFKHVGKERCPIINISGGTEIIGCLLSALPITSLKSCSLGQPGLGVDADVFDEEGKPIRNGIGHLVCKQPIPSMTKGFLNDDKRYLETYFSKWKGVWYHGDWAEVDGDGHWFLHGRSDDTIKIAGKRIGPVEFEAALMTDPDVSEAAAVGVPDDLKGEACICYVVLKPSIQGSEPLRSRLTEVTRRALGKSMAPRAILFTEALPKTRSAKIIRGMIRKLYLNEPISDTSSVENQSALDAIRNAY